MEPKLNQSAPLRRFVTLTAIAILTTSAANSAAFGTQGDEGKKQTPTNSESTAGSKTGEAMMAAQAPLLVAAERIKKLDSKGAGLGGIRLNTDKHTLEVWWKGDPPSAVREEIARQEREHGIKTVLGSAQYSQRELIALARGIVSKAADYPGLVSAGPAVDGTGLEIGATDTARASAFKFQVPVHVVLGASFTPLARANYIPPGAAAVTRPAIPAARLCSTGFAMGRFFLWFRTSSGILSAEHCSCGGNVVFNTGTGSPIGTAEPTSGKSVFTDSVYIPTSNFGTINYDGGVGVGEFTKPVVGTQSNFPGMFVCTSGAGTGVHCNISIDSVNQAFSAGFCPATQPFTEGISLAHEVSGAAATGVGDSGGSVFTLAASPSTVNAAGMMFGGLTPVACGAFGTSCFNAVAFNDIDSLQSAHGANVLLAPPPSSGGGWTIISTLVFAAATLLWVLAELRRRTKTRPHALGS